MFPPMRALMLRRPVELLLLALLPWSAGASRAQEPPTESAATETAVAAVEQFANALRASISSDDAADRESDGSQTAAAAELQPPDAAEKKALEERLAALDAAGLGDEDKKRAAELYQQAIKSFDAAIHQFAAASAFEAELERTRQGKQSTAEYAAKLDAPLPPYADTAGLPLSTIEQWAENCETNLAYYRQELAAMMAEPKRRTQRMADMPGQIAETQQRLKQAANELAALGAEDSADAIAAARRAALASLQRECQAALHALQREQQLYQHSGEWVTVRRDYYARYVPHKEKRLAQLREAINRLREQETRRQAQAAAAAAAQAVEVKRPKQIIDLANRNKQLAEERKELVAAIERATRDADATLALHTNLDAQYRSAQTRAEKLSHAAGQLLRDQQTKLPDLRELQRSFAAREPVLSEVLLRTYELQDKSAELANLDELADRIASQAGDLSAASLGAVRELLEAQRVTIDQLIADYTTYSTRLNSLHRKQADLIDLTSRYADFIAARVLWIRNCAPPVRSDFSHAVHAAAWSLDPHNWLAAGRAALDAGRRKPAQMLLYTLGLLALVVAQHPARRRLNELGEEAQKRSCTQLAPTVHALGLTALVTLPWPALLLLAGWTLDGLSESEFVRSLGAAARFAAVCLLLIELSRGLCRRGGLAEAHFDWPRACLAHFRRKLRWLAIFGTPLALWLVGLETQSSEPYWNTSLGRALFIGLMLLLATVFYRLLLAAASPFREIVIIRSGWLAPVRVLWRPAAVLLPIALAGLALAGYYFTALQAAVRILQTVAMLLAVVTLGGVTRRWLLLSRRRLAREQVRQRRAQLAAAAAADDPTAQLAADVADDAVDLAALSEQTQKLVRTFLAITMAVGLVLIWGEILPALKYPAKHVLPGATTLTWGDLVSFALIVAVTYVSVRDVPALLELAILQHLPLDGGARYAWTTMTRYLIAGAGITAAFTAVGGQWNKIQWLVAAMSVGLGFGLQEIFANFVSGIILLFERPIRVGDVVTLGETTGAVSRIRMRATTIVDHDRKELIVPNKDLISGRLLNWTLTDPVNRITVNVRVAYGSDVELARQLLLEAACEQPHVLTDPQPVAIVDGFGESSQNLRLTCFLPTLENRLMTIHGLHATIGRKFKAAGLEIPVPQRQVKMRISRDALDFDFAGANASAARRAAEERRHDAA